MKDDRKSSKYPAPGQTFIPYQFGNSALLQRNVLRDPDLLLIEKTLWILLSHYAGEDGDCSPSNDRLAQDLAVSKTWVKKAVSGLIQKGFITKEHPRKGWRYTAQFHFVWRESFAENPFSRDQSFTPGNGNGNGRGDTHVTSNDQLVTRTSPVTSETHFTSSEGKGSLQCTISEQEEGNCTYPHEIRGQLYLPSKGVTIVSQEGNCTYPKVKKKRKKLSEPPPPRNQRHNVCAKDPDEGKGGGGFFVVEKSEKPSAQKKALIKEYVDLSVQREIHKGTEITNKAAYRSKIKSRVMNETDQETFLEELEELRGWKREQDETEELRRQAREQEEERKRQEEIHRQEFEKLKANLMTEYEQSGMTEEEFYRSKPEDDNPVQCALWELFQDTGRKIAREKFDETIGKPQSKKKAAQKGRSADASLTDEQREALLLKQFESIKDSLASLPHEAETAFCSMQAKLFDRQGDEQGIRCLNKLFHGGRHCALKDEIGRLAEETFNPESTKPTPPQLTFQTFKDILKMAKSKEVREKLCQDYPEHSNRLQQEYPFWDRQQCANLPSISFRE